MNILILGSTGYLGSKITKRLAEKGHKLICVKRQNSDLSRLIDLEYKVNWISTSVDEIEAVMKKHNFDWIINLACNYGHGNILYDCIIEANMEFPLKVLNIAIRSGVSNYLTIGTGLPNQLNMYSFSKKMFGEFGRFYAYEHKVNFYNLCLEMFYGSDEPTDRFIPSIIHKMLKGMEVNTTFGTQQRDIIAIQDVVQAVMMVMESGKKGYFDIPIGTGIAPTISEIIDYIWIETNKKSKINKGAIQMRKNEPDCIADTAFLKSIGTWEPIYWKNGIQQMIVEINKSL